MKGLFFKYLHIPVAILLCMMPFLDALPQQPAYFMLGEEQFKGLQVFDVIQDKNDNYLFSTNEGVFYYDYLHFEPIACDLARSNSVFNFVSDKTGTVYCSNLNQQIFKIKDKKCSLFYTLLPDEASPDVNLICTPAGDLLACSKKIIRLSAAGEVLERQVTPTLPWGRPFKTPDGAILLHYPNTDSILLYQDDRFSVHRLKGLNKKSSDGLGLGFFAVDNQIYAVDIIGSAVFAIQANGFQARLLPDKYMMDRSLPLRLYTAGKTTWVAGSSLGAVWFKSRPEITPPKLLYPKYFVSNVFQDREGNILLATFDRGVLVIPDPAIPDVIDTFEDEPITALYFDHSAGFLYLGNTKGNLLRFKDGELHTLFDGGSRSVEGIFGTDLSETLIFQGGDQIMYAHPDKGILPIGLQAALKDAVFVNPDLAFLATSRGIFRCEWNGGTSPEITVLPGFEFRIHHMVHDKPGNALVASSARGLFHIPLNGRAKRIALGKQDVFPTTMSAAGAKVYLASRQHGIMVLENGRLSAPIVPEIGRLEYLNKLIIDGDRIFAKSSQGIYQLGMDGRVQRNIGKAFGFFNVRVYDFELQAGRLWVSHSGGVQSIELALSGSGQTPPMLRIAKITVNDKSVPATISGDFLPDERKIRFDIAYPSLRNRAAARIHYKLQGYEERWSIKADEESAIIYNALGPGTYTFWAKAENQGVFSPPVAYSFSIAAPFYRRWWFTALALAAAAGLMGAIYRKKLALQEKKARQINELNASKLTAIQSQMNPHFIFNAMNSIQDLILKGDVENSYSYVTTFSNLVRSTLKYSEKDFIDFEQESELLRLYLSLEKLRFEDELSFEILDEVGDDIQIPPFIIQPFVENALLHGLLHKPGAKLLTIKFSLQESLVCTIQDNGIGRVRAMQIRERQRGDHESFSGKAIKKRFDILSGVFKGKFGYFYEDLMENGEASGTRITLNIPVRRRF